MPLSGNSNRILRKAFEGIISVLGPSGEKAIISELKSRCDYDQDYLDAALVRETLEHLFGPDSAGLLLEQVFKVESRLESRIARIKSAQT
jgi:hypothetical protein